MDDNEILVAKYLGMNTDQLADLKNCLDNLRKIKNGFGSIKINVKRFQIYNFSYTVDSKPFFKKIIQIDEEDMEKF